MPYAAKSSVAESTQVRISEGPITLEGELSVPESATGIVLFAHGSGSSRHSPRNQYVARVIREAGVGTLLCDLLTQQEEAIDNYTRALRFDIGLLARRLISATYWLGKQDNTEHLTVGYFGASTGAGAALVAAAAVGEKIGAVVSRGGRPDLAGEALERVRVPTLLIVGSRDLPVIELNQRAYNQLHCIKQIEIVPGATHLFEEPGTLEQAANLAAAWFVRHLRDSRKETRK